MRFDLITLFPELFGPHLSSGVTRRAFESGQVDVKLWQLRDFADDNYRRVDDRPYGGGPGMVMLVEPLERALAAVKQQRGGAKPAVIHFSPTGRRIDQALMQEMAQGPGGVLLCGRYEGIDQRFLDRHVTLELSLGDFVLSGGELPALALLDGIARLQEGVLNDAASHQQDSFSDGLLDCPHYSRPEVLRGLEGQVEDLPVPAVLMSGHHAQIKRWRRERQLEITLQRRPELIEAARREGRLSRSDEAFLSALLPR
jgi:tRNA (guanine37-N1)-methyltransferase